MAERFRGRAAVVAGTSDRGFGGAIAERLAREGAFVTMLDRNPPQRLLGVLEKHACQFQWCETDITVQAEVDAAVTAAHQQLGRLDVVVNAAGVAVIDRLDRLSDEQWRRAFEVDVMGAMRVVRAAVPLLTDFESAVVTVSSSMGLNGCRGYSLYSMAKAGLIGMTNSLAAELAPRGIRAVSVAPGLAHTPMIHKLADTISKDERDTLQATHPLGMGTSHDVAATVAFLASHEAQWITGVTIPLGWGHLHPLPVDALLDGDGYDTSRSDA